MGVKDVIIFAVAVSILFAFVLMLPVWVVIGAFLAATIEVLF